MQNHGSIKKSMKLLFGLLIICYGLFTFLNAANVKATLSSSEIVQGNMAQLKIKAIGDKVDFSNIKDIGGIKILGQHESQHSSFTYINGKVKNEQATTMILTFAPQKNMTIPSYKINIDGKVYKTDPLKLKVVKATVPKANGKEKFSLQLKANKKSVMVGESFMATVYFSLQHGVRLSENPQYNKPQFKDFFVKEVDDEKVYNEGNRQVTELRYILTPKYEGNFTVEPATAKIGVADRNRRDMFGRFFGTSWTPIASNTIDIEVKQKPDNSELVGSFVIENSIDLQSIKANKPVNLTIKIIGEGSLEDFEFPIYDIADVTVYSNDAKISTKLINGKIESTYIKNFVFIASSDFTVPSREISVYDTKSKSIEQLEVPSYNVTVEGKKALVSSMEAEANKGKVQTNIAVPEKSMLDGEKRDIEVKNTEWWMVILSFISGMLVMYMLRFIPSIKWKRSSSSIKESEALKILYSHINESKEVEQMVRKLYAKKNGDKSVVIDKKELNEIIENIRIKNL